MKSVCWKWTTSGSTVRAGSRRSAGVERLLRGRQEEVVVLLLGGDQVLARRVGQLAELGQAAVLRHRRMPQRSQPPSSRSRVSRPAGCTPRCPPASWRDGCGGPAGPSLRRHGSSWCELGNLRRGGRPSRPRDSSPRARSALAGAARTPRSARATRRRWRDHDPLRRLPARAPRAARSRRRSPWGGSPCSCPCRPAGSAARRRPRSSSSSSPRLTTSVAASGRHDHGGHAQRACRCGSSASPGTSARSRGSAPGCRARVPPTRLL